MNVLWRVPRCNGGKGDKVPDNVAAERKPLHGGSRKNNESCCLGPTADASPQNWLPSKTAEEIQRAGPARGAGDAPDGAFPVGREQSEKCFRVMKLKNKCQLWETWNGK